MTNSTVHVIGTGTEGFGEARNCLSYSFDMMLTILHSGWSQVFVA